MIAECAADLLAKFTSVGNWATAPSLSTGGKSGDPGLVKIPIPAAWVNFAKDANDELPYEHSPPSGVIGPPQVMATFAATIFLPYTTDDDLLTVQFPRLKAIILAIHSTDVAGSAGTLQWRYAGQRIALVYPDRLAYEQRYTVNFIYQ